MWVLNLRCSVSIDLMKLLSKILLHGATRIGKKIATFEKCKLASDHTERLLKYNFVSVIYILYQLLHSTTKTISFKKVQNGPRPDWKTVKGAILYQCSVHHMSWWNLYARYQLLHSTAKIVSFTKSAKWPQTRLSLIVQFQEVNKMHGFCDTGGGERGGGPDVKVFSTRSHWFSLR